MDPMILELAKLGISVFLQASRVANMSEEQIRKLFNEEKVKFDAKNPNDLNQV